ncbi:MAG: hypothetical protein CALGDGBN_02653 [Pseudomonadales bacterium]|nr:hypothetical protein [Pseudomonadales bacterium]
MAMNPRIQFQPGLSMPEFFARFGTEEEHGGRVVVSSAKDRSNRLPMAHHGLGCAFRPWRTLVPVMADSGTHQAVAHGKARRRFCKKLICRTATFPCDH